MDFGSKDDLIGIRLAQEAYVDRLGWRAAGYRWYLQDGGCGRGRRLCEIAFDVAAVMWARAGAIVAAGVSPYLVVRECRRAFPALFSLGMLIARPKKVQPGHLRKVFRYAYCGFDKRRNTQPIAL